MTQRQAAIILIAMVAHNVNKAYCDAIGDTSQKEWDESPEWQKNSAVAGVEAQLANPDMTPEQRHNSWYDHKVADGWKYGQVKDAEKKTHPCLVGYGMLPEKDRVKDYLFGAVVSSLVPEFAAALASSEEVVEGPDNADVKMQLDPAPELAPSSATAVEEVKSEQVEEKVSDDTPAPSDLGPGIFEEESGSIISDAGNSAGPQNEETGDAENVGSGALVE